jgi:adenylylsulfate kinase
MLSKQKDASVVWHNATVTRDRRQRHNGHRSAVLWFTGLSGAGKSTLAHAVEEELHKQGYRTIVLDGDNVRHGLCSDLGFSDGDRSENLRRIGEVSKLFVEAGLITLAAFISPIRVDRLGLRNMMHEGDFFEIYCKCSIEVCEYRDIKGMYKRARAGEISNFTGVSSPYEEPEHPDLLVDTGTLSLQDSVALVLQFLKNANLLTLKVAT